LYGIIGGLVITDITLLAIMMLYDPLKKHVLNLSTQAGSDSEILHEPVIKICDCSYQKIWVGIQVALKGILLLLGLYLSYETRNAKIKRINDSKFVALSVYNIVVRFLLMIT
jgi:gamma-aminobutyric acid type B receptor